MTTLDGSHIRAFIAQQNLAMEESERVSFTICSHCLRLWLASYLLIYCLLVWEGLTHDSLVLEDGTSKGFEQFKLLRQRYVGNKVMRLCAVHTLYLPQDLLIITTAIPRVIAV